MIDDPLSKEKRELLEKLLKEGTVMIHLDARDKGVLVPEHLRQDPHLRLNLDYGFRIPDFEIREKEVFAPLSFSQKRYPCTLPFSAIWGITSTASGQSVIFPTSVPTEVWQTLSLAGQTTAQPQKPEPTLQLAPSPQAESKELVQEPEQTEKTNTPKRRNHLRLIKS